MTGWQPIDTAPKDDATVLCYFPALPEGRRIQTANWYDSREIIDGRPIQKTLGWPSSALNVPGPQEATHWMLLPGPPEAPK